MLAKLRCASRPRSLIVLRFCRHQAFQHTPAFEAAIEEGKKSRIEIADGHCASMSQQRSAQTRVALAQFPTTALVKADFRRALSQPHSQSRPPS